MTPSRPSHTSLPIDAVLSDLLDAVKISQFVVVEAEPGAGKTTRVPLAVFEAGICGSRSVIVSEPRRLAARLAACFVAESIGEPPGKTIGYSVRFEDVSSRATRVRYVTEGVLLNQLSQEPNLESAGVVILDEFHERHLETDVCLALLRQLCQRRSDLRVIVMSATLEGERLAEHLGGCPRVHSHGRSYPLTIEYEPLDDRPLERRVASAVKAALAKHTTGSVLVFLPGAREIALCQERLTGKLGDAVVLPLHGDMPIAEQSRAVTPGADRRVVLSTNVAESSVTVPDVTVVVDSGLARVAGYSPWTGRRSLDVQEVSQASATQRAGRAGRVAPGHVVRLYTEGNFRARRAHDLPELQRLDLAQTLLILRGLKLDPEKLSWPDPPPRAAVQAAQRLLELLGALNVDGSLTEVGRRMLDVKLPPRLARLVVAATDHGIEVLGALAAAILSERDFVRGSVPAEFAHNSDVTARIAVFLEARDANFRDSAMRRWGIDGARVKAVDRAFRHLTRRHAELSTELETADDALGRSLLAAFADRVAKRKAPNAPELIMMTGRQTRLSDQSVASTTFLLAIDLEERRTGMHGGSAWVRLAHDLDPDWLLEHEQLLEERDEYVWSESAQRVEHAKRIACGSVIIDESLSAAAPGPEAQEVLLRVALSRKAQLLGKADVLETLRGRMRVLSEVAPFAHLDALGELDAETLLSKACRDRTEFSELEELDLQEVVLSDWPPEERARLEQLAPRSITLPNGKQFSIHYSSDKPPLIASYLQDFFGISEGPRIGAGRVPLTLHLWAPNRRPVQVTSDLAGFWDNHYPRLRRELGRRYPKHAWPEDGRTATPPRRGGLKRK